MLDARKAPSIQHLASSIYFQKGPAPRKNRPDLCWQASFSRLSSSPVSGEEVVAWAHSISTIAFTPPTSCCS